MPRQLNTSEEFVHWVCQQSFLSLWSYASPRGKKRKELCDVLVVCDPDVIIISVKDIGFFDAGESASARKRWMKRAVDESVKQIYGAERWIVTTKHVVRHSGSEGLPIPNSETRRIHRVAVAVGAKGKVGFPVGDFGKGYVHVMDEQSFQTVLSELDTISDFVAYLAAKQQLTSRAAVIFEGEENLLAVYLHGNRSFPEGPDFIVVQPDLWETFTAKPEVQQRAEANRASYAWDRLIESLSAEILSDTLPVGPGLPEYEQCVRIMAREDRFCRRVLGKSYSEFLLDAKARKIRARLMRSPSEMSYVLLRMPADEDRERLLAEMRRRCLVARSLSSASPTIIGIGVTDLPEQDAFSITVVQHSFPEWTEAHEKLAKEIQDTLGEFRSSRLTSVPEDEYPKAQAQRQETARPKAKKKKTAQRRTAASKKKKSRAKKK